MSNAFGLAICAWDANAWWIVWNTTNWWTVLSTLVRGVHFRIQNSCQTYPKRIPLLLSSKDWILRNGRSRSGIGGTIWQQQKYFLSFLSMMLLLLWLVVPLVLHTWARISSSAWRSEWNSSPLCVGRSPSASEGGEVDPLSQSASHGFIALRETIFLLRCSTHCNNYIVGGIFTCKNYWEVSGEEDGGEVEAGAARRAPTAWLRRHNEANVNAPSLTNRGGALGPPPCRWRSALAPRACNHR